MIMVDLEYFSFKVQPLEGRSYVVSVMATRADVARRAVSLDKEDTITEVKLSSFEKNFRKGLVKQKFKNREKVVFFRGIAGFLENNSARNPAEALPMIAASMRTPFSRGVCVVIEEMMAKEGIQTLSEAMEYFPQAFDAYDLNMVRTGDTTGNLQEVLEILATHVLKWLALQSKIKKAVTYPGVMLASVIAVGSFLLMKVVPDLLGGFATMGVEMPTPVVILDTVSGLLQQYWYVPVFLAVAAIACLIIFWSKVNANTTFQRCVLKAPVFGKLIHKVSLAQSLAALGMFMKSGKTDVDSLPIVASLCKNVVFREYYELVLESVKQGIDISTSFMRAKNKVGIAEGSVIAAQLQLGLSSGAIREAVEAMVIERERDVEDYTDQLPELLNPILMALIMGLGTCIVVPVFMALFAVVGGLA